MTDPIAVIDTTEEIAASERSVVIDVIAGIAMNAAARVTSAGTVATDAIVGTMTSSSVCASRWRTSLAGSPPRAGFFASRCSSTPIRSKAVDDKRLD